MFSGTGMLNATWLD